jgi:hypothetical protein
MLIVRQYGFPQLFAARTSQQHLTGAEDALKTLFFILEKQLIFSCRENGWGAFLVAVPGEKSHQYTQNL